MLLGLLLLAERLLNMLCAVMLCAVMLLLMILVGCPLTQSWEVLLVSLRPCLRVSLGSC